MLRCTLGLLAVVGLLSFSDSPAVAAVHQGKVLRVDEDEYEIVIADAQGKEQSFAVDENCKITVNGEVADLEDLDEGAKVKITTTNRKGAVVAVKIEAKSPKGARNQSGFTRMFFQRHLAPLGQPLPPCTCTAMLPSRPSVSQTFAAS